MKNSQYLNDLTERATAERQARPDQIFGFSFDLLTVVSVISSLRLALTHPDNKNAIAYVTSGVVELMVAALKSEGFPAAAELSTLERGPTSDHIN
jgi:hypothetical protein